MDDYYVGANMFVYYSSQQVCNQDYKGPDVFFAKHAEGQRKRLYWAIWDEYGRYPDVLFELLSASTEQNDLGFKKQLYEQHFRAPEYFCIAPEMERLLGWRLVDGVYQPIMPDEHGRLWSKELDLWLGRWQGTYLAEEHIWPRFYHPDGNLVLLPDEAALVALEAERQRADSLAEQLAALQAELERLRGAKME
jgi:Uma2 family endonuclease